MSYGELRRRPDGSYWPDPGDHFCFACDGTGTEIVDDVACRCIHCDGVNRRPEGMPLPNRTPRMRRI